MAYFPNGTAGDVYQTMYCDRCIHREREDEDGNDIGCPVWDAHILLEYVDEKTILDMLIPMKNDGIEADQCRMFIDGDPDRPPSRL